MLKLTDRHIYLNIIKFMKVSPKIGLSMRLEIETNRFYLGRDYCEALQNFGAIPLHIGLIPDEKYISEALSTSGRNTFAGQ